MVVAHQPGGGVYFANQFTPARERKCRQLECMLERCQLPGGRAEPLEIVWHDHLTGWVGVVWSKENSLINNEAPLDHLESLRFLADYS